MTNPPAVRMWQVLMVDDDEDDYILTRSMLERAQGRTIHLDWARTVEEGREKLNQSRFDAVLVDYDLGAVTGIDLIRELSGRNYSAPLILYTGRGSFEVDMEAMQAGATLYLPKGDANPLMLERSIRYAIERKQSIDTLRESEERFRSLLENSIDVAYRRNLQTDCYDYMSPVSSQVLGYTPEEMNNMPVEEVLDKIHPDDRSRVEHGLEEALEKGIARLTYRFLTPCCGYRWLADFVSIQKDAGGKPLYRTGILRDITEQKEVEQALRESEELFRVLADNISQLAWMADANGDIFWYNQRWFDYTGTTFDEVKGWGWQKVHHPGYVERVTEKLRYCFENGIVWEDTFPMRSKDGQYRWFLSRALPLRDENSRVVRWFGTNTDITGQLVAEQTLRHSEERLRLALGGAKQGIWDWNLATDEVVWDERCNQIFGLPPGKHVTFEELVKNVVYPEDAQYFLEHPRQFTPEDSEVEDDFRVVLPDGSIRWVFVKGQAYFDENGQMYRLAGAMQDITDRKQVEYELKAYADQLQRSNQMLEDFAFIASHDLQEPLRKVQSFSQLMRAKFGDQVGPEGSEYLTRMDSAARRMSAMLAGLLEYSRISITTEPFQDIDLRKIVEEVVSDLEFRIANTRGRVVVDSLPVIQADALQMYQLFQNLISNALKFHRPEVPPLVRVDSRILPDGKVAVSISDNGIGFEMTHAAQLFEPFYRVRNKENVDGSGIGLAICKKIVERHHGRLEAESRPGVGSTFTLILPQKQAF